MKRETSSLAALREDFEELALVTESLTLAIENLIQAVANLSRQVRLLGPDRFDIAAPEKKRSIQ